MTDKTIANINRDIGQGEVVDVDDNFGLTDDITWGVPELDYDEYDDEYDEEYPKPGRSRHSRFLAVGE